MLSFDLAKKLKDAGFVVRNHSLVPRQILHDEKWAETIGEPTLSELIEACGDKFWYLRLDQPTKWLARSNEDLFEVKTTQFVPYSDTPEEAVARLWLALHGKG